MDKITVPWLASLKNENQLKVNNILLTECETYTLSISNVNMLFPKQH